MTVSNPACPLCASTDARHMATVKDLEYFTSLEDYDYFDCNACGCVFLKDPPSDRLAEIYPDNYYAVSGPDEATGFLSKALEKIKTRFDRRLFSGVLKKLPCETIDCLDVGGGAGWIMNLVRRCDRRVRTTTIVDINENSRATAEANGHVYINEPVEALSARDEFDFVLLLNLIEHVAAPDEVLTSLHAGMRKNGLLLIKTPNTDSLDRRLFEKRYWGGYHAPRHFVLFNKENFSKMAAASGFAIEEFSYTQGAPQWAASVLGTWSKAPDGSKRAPIYTSKLFPVLMLFFATFDFLRLPFSKTDQMFIVLRKV